MSSVGERLKEERGRVGLTQQALASSCGVNKRAVVNYEGDENFPGGAFLANAHRLGVDVVYVLTGDRTGELSAKELGLVAAFRAASEELQRAALSVLGAGVPVVASPSGKAKLVFTGDTRIGQQVTGDGDIRDTTINMGDGRK